MNGVRMRPVEIRCARHIGGDNVYLLAPEPTEVIVEGHRRPALRGQEQLGHHQEWRFHGRERSRHQSVAMSSVPSLA